MPCGTAYFTAQSLDITEGSMKKTHKNAEQGFFRMENRESALGQLVGTNLHHWL
jgi:hypothetical protein